MAGIAAQGPQLLGPLRRRCSNDAALPQWIFLPALTTRCHETVSAHYDPKRPRSTGTTPYIQLLLLWAQTSFSTNLECLMVRFKGVSSTSNGPSPSYNKISTPN